LHEPLAGRQGATRSRSAVADRLDHQAAKSGSHRTLQRPGSPDFVFAFHDRDEISPRMLARIAKHTGLTEDDL
jgi:hypothetical protein